MNPPDAEAARDSASAPWRRPQLGTSGFERYLHTLRERLRLIAAVTIATTIVAVLYLVVADDKYRAEADLLVSPASQNDTALTGLPVIHESSDPTRDVSTAARLVTSRDVAAGFSASSASTRASASCREPFPPSRLRRATSSRCERRRTRLSSPRISPTALRRRWWPSALRSCAVRSTSSSRASRSRLRRRWRARRTRRSSAGSSLGFRACAQRATPPCAWRPAHSLHRAPLRRVPLSPSRRGSSPGSSSVWAPPSR